MTQVIQQATAPVRTIVTPSSRYLKQNLIYYGERRILTFDTYLRQKYVPNGKEKVTVISKGMEYRPDLASYYHYGFPDNWWRILEANNMKDVWEFKAGTTIMLPDQLI